MLVTFVGIVLSAWLLPAVAKQWDDRPKAQQLKVSLVGEIAAASATAIGNGERFVQTQSDRSLRAETVRA
jgi:hypothetical protein